MTEAEAEAEAAGMEGIEATEARRRQRLKHEAIKTQLKTKYDSFTCLVCLQYARKSPPSPPLPSLPLPPLFFPGPENGPSVLNSKIFFFYRIFSWVLP